MFYVYQYIDPRTMLPFYIGKGTADRKYAHLKETLQTTINKRKYYRIRAIRRAGLEPIIEEIKSFIIESESYDYEELLIKKYGRKHYDIDGILTNICINSRPPSRKGIKCKFTDEHRKNLSESLKGKPKEYKTWQVGLTKETDERIKKMAENRSKTGNNHLVGKKHNPDRIEKVRQKLLGRTIPADQRKKMSDAKIGKTWEEIFGEEESSRRRLNMKSGKDHHRSKSIQTPDGIFTSIKEAVNYFNLSDFTIRKRCVSDKEKWKEWFYICI